jgi:4-hydroxy-3-methylbut-2-enyl diphosphate reductase
MSSVIFRKGLDLKEAVATKLSESYHSLLVDQIKAADFCLRSGRLTIHLARKFGFCYGVDRAVDYAYQTRERFPARRVYLTGEIIHNPHVNNRLRGLGIRFLTDPGVDPRALGPEDVVIIPAFGVTITELARLDRQGCTLVDTTCGSVLNVWKNVRRYAQDGFTAIIHGKVSHEETRATASQALLGPGGHYLVVLDTREATEVCEYIRQPGHPSAAAAPGTLPDSREPFLSRFMSAVSDGFDPDRDLVRVGLANQTTMLMSESLEVEAMFRSAMIDRYGEPALADHFRAFDTICSATQDRQDAVVALLSERPLDLMIVIGGYNSSNTCNLARICAERLPTYHIAEPQCLDSSHAIRHQPLGSKTEVTTLDWLPGGPVSIGLTAGASTPDNLVGAVVQTLDTFCGRTPGN